MERSVRALPEIHLVVFDMAGTTVADRGEVQACFLQAAEHTGLRASRERVLSMMGWSKRRVFETLWAEQLGPDAPERADRIETSYGHFRRILEQHYRTMPVRPTEGCLECFGWLRSEGIAIALTTGFYRKVADIILHRLGWDRGLNARHVGTGDTTIQASVCSDEVPSGRPAPDMIHRAMALLGIVDVRGVVKVGDTQSDLHAGRSAGCGLTLAVTNGTHTAEQLGAYPNDGLLRSLHDLRPRLQAGVKGEL
jgi:phosphonatase-like hydrolase